MPSNKEKHKNLLKDSINEKLCDLRDKSDVKGRKKKIKNVDKERKKEIEELKKENAELKKLLNKFMPSSSTENNNNYYSTLMDLTDNETDSDVSDEKAEDLKKLRKNNHKETNAMKSNIQKPLKPQANEISPERENNNKKKMPPINLYDTEINRLKNLMKNRLNITNFLIKEHNNTNATLYTFNLEDFNKARQLLQEAVIDHYTYTPKCEKKITYVLKGLNNTYTPEEVLEHLNTMQIPNTKFEKVLRLTTKHSIENNIKLPHYIVQASPDSLSAEIEKIRAIDYQVVHWEKIVKSDIKQCTRCQRFTHSAANCFMKFRCVKCGKNHTPGQCLITPDDPKEKLFCILCEKYGHPASYRNCPEYKKRLVHHENIKEIKQQKIVSKHLASNFINKNISFANIIKNNSNNNNSQFKNNNNYNSLNTNFTNTPDINNNILIEIKNSLLILQNKFTTLEKQIMDNKNKINFIYNNTNLTSNQQYELF